jgi:UDP-N-acetylmuramate-alanine ligase
MEVRGESGGVTIVDDFAHHPTAIRETIQAARLRWPGRRLWAVVEPRSNTMRRKVFESALPTALSGADAVVLGPVNRPQPPLRLSRFQQSAKTSNRPNGSSSQAFAVPFFPSLIS